MGIRRARLADATSWILVACVIVTTILIVRREFADGADSSPDPPTRTAAIESPQAIAGWEEALRVGLQTGPEDAPVQLVEFADFQCPYCARFEAVVEKIRTKYVQQVAFTFVHVPLPQHEFAMSASVAAECAHEAGRFAEMRAILFEKQRAFGLVEWEHFAKQAGIVDLQQFQRCLGDHQVRERVMEALAVAKELEVRGTPTVVLNGWVLPKPPSFEELDVLVADVLDGKSPGDAARSVVTNARPLQSMTDPASE